MMSNFSKVHDFLMHEQNLHARIADYYRELSAQASNEQVKMLLQLLVKHEITLSTSLRDYIEKASAKVLNTFIQFEREINIKYLFNNEFKHGQISCDDVEVIAHGIDQYFSELYADMFEAIECDMVQTLFENLRQHMEQEKKRLSIDINSMKDM